MDLPFSFDRNLMETFVKALKNNGIIGMPTETVYGLAGNALSDEAVLKIYDMKKRPPVNPLIIHVATLEQALHYGEFDADALTLAKHFWPPSPHASSLTLVVPLRRHYEDRNSVTRQSTQQNAIASPSARNDYYIKHRNDISKYVTAGLDTIAIRVPNHPVALELLKQCDFPVAAPSANLSTMLSPTKKEHVIFDIPVLEGGPCQVGIESTIVKGNTILRPGIITKSMLEDVLGKTFLINQNETTIQAPGMMKKHYSPKTPVVLNSTQYDLSNEALLGFGDIQGTMNLSVKGDLREAAQNLFAYLYELDQKKYARIHIAPLPYEQELSDSIYDKLKRMI